MIADSIINFPNLWYAPPSGVLQQIMPSNINYMGRIFEMGPAIMHGSYLGVCASPGHSPWLKALGLDKNERLENHNLPVHAWAV